MGLLDGVKKSLGDIAGATERAISETGSRDIPMAFAKFYPGGLAAFLDRLRADGHGAAVDSWLGEGGNRPVPAGAVAACLPEAVVARMAHDLSLPPDRVATALAEFLPAAVAGQSEGGKLRPQPAFSTQEG